MILFSFICIPSRLGLQRNRFSAFSLKQEKLRSTFPWRFWCLHPLTYGNRLHFLCDQTVDNMINFRLKSSSWCVSSLELFMYEFAVHKQGCQNKPAIGAFHRLFRILRRLLRMLVDQFWVWYWRNKMEIAAYFLDATSYSKTYWQPWFLHGYIKQDETEKGHVRY